MLLTCNRHAGSRTLSLLRYVFLSGFFLMSRYVCQVFLLRRCNHRFHNHSRTRTSGTPVNRIRSVVSIVSPILSFSPSYSLTSTFLIDSPELGPGAVIGASGVSTSSSTSPTGSPMPSLPVNHNSNTGAIVGGVVGGVAAISIAVAVIFFYLRRRRSRAPSAAALGVGASQPPVDELKQPLTEEGTNTGSSLPGTSSMPGTPGAPMRLYVRVFISSTALLYVLITCTFLRFLIRRTRMIQLHFLATKGICSHRPLLKDPRRHTTRSETPWPPRKPWGHRGITVCLLSDFALMNHRSHRSGVQHIVVLLHATSFKSSRAFQGQN